MLEEVSLLTLGRDLNQSGQIKMKNVINTNVNECDLWPKR